MRTKFLYKMFFLFGFLTDQKPILVWFVLVSVHAGRSRWACAGQGVSFCAGQGRWSCVGWSRRSCAGRSVDVVGVGTCRRGVDSVGV